jgi:hypothetical protein
MRDPHVVALHYHLETGPQLKFSNAPPVEDETASFIVRLAGGCLRAELTDDPATVAAAYGQLNKYLRAWEISANLKYGAGAIRFRFEGAEVIDGPPGAELSEALRDLLRPKGKPTLSVGMRRTLGQFPVPPVKFAPTPDVISMWERFEGYKKAREPLPAMAQFCLTTIEQSVGGKQARKGAAARYAIDFEVLRHLGRLTSVVGDARTGRKRTPTLRPHTPAEIAWMEAVVTRLIQRMGEWEADQTASWPLITMGDFPRL